MTMCLSIMVKFTKGGRIEDPIAAPAEIISLAEETVRFYFRLRYAANQIHGEGTLTGGWRGILRVLRRNGPMTVPNLARSRPVSRQAAQSVVNNLLKNGLVDRIPNPAHKRSRLVQLTDAGARAIDRLSRRELELAAHFAPDFRLEDLRVAEDALRRLRGMLESDRWEEFLR